MTNKTEQLLRKMIQIEINAILEGENKENLLHTIRGLIEEESNQNDLSRHLNNVIQSIKSMIEIIEKDADRYEKTNRPLYRKSINMIDDLKRILRDDFGPTRQLKIYIDYQHNK